jgi:hypothetical protein
MVTQIQRPDHKSITIRSYFCLENDKIYALWITLLMRSLRLALAPSPSRSNGTPKRRLKRRTSSVGVLSAKLLGSVFACRGCQRRPAHCSYQNLSFNAYFVYESSMFCENKAAFKYRLASI